MITSVLLPLFLGTASISTPLAPASSHAAWHPGDSAVYVEMPDIAATRTAWAQSAIARMLADAEVHQAIGALMGQESVDPVPMVLARVRESLPPGQYDLAIRLLDQVRGFSMSVRPTETSRDAVADGIDSPEAALTAFGFQVVLNFASAEAPTQVMDLIAQGMNAQGAEFILEDISWNGQSGAMIRGLGPGDLGDHIRLVRSGANLVLIAGVNGLDEVRERMEGSGESMATSANWTSKVSSFSSAGTVIADVFADVAGYAPIEANEAQQLAPILELAEGLLGTNGAMLRGGRWRMRLNNGVYVTDGFQPRNPEIMLEHIVARGRSIRKRSASSIPRRSSLGPCSSIRRLSSRSFVAKARRTRATCSPSSNTSTASISPR